MRKPTPDLMGPIDVMGEVLAAKPADVQGLGHLFQGAMDLERAGVGERPMEEIAAAAPVVDGAKPAADAPKTPVEYRRSAMNHLRKAADASIAASACSCVVCQTCSSMCFSIAERYV